MCASVACSKFLNVDDNIDLCVREKTSKDPGLKADRDGGADGNPLLPGLSDREKAFQIVEVPGAGNRIALRAPDDYFLAVEPNETKTKVLKNAVAAAITAAAATAAASATSAASASPAAAAAAASSSSSTSSAAVPSSPSSSSSCSSSAASCLGVGVGNGLGQAGAPPRPTDFALTPAQLFEPLWLDDRSPLTLQGRVIIKVTIPSLPWRRHCETPEHSTARSLDDSPTHACVLCLCCLIIACVQTAHDKLWCAEPGGVLVANRRCVSLWEPLVLVPHSLTHVAFLSAHGTFLSLLGNNNNSNSQQTNPSSQNPAARPQSQPQPQLPAHQLGFVCTSSPSSAELFQVVEVDRFAGLYCFVAANGRFVTAQGNHQLSASANTQGPWQRFQVTTWNQDVVGS